MHVKGRRIYEENAGPDTGDEKMKEREREMISALTDDDLKKTKLPVDRGRWKYIERNIYEYMYMLIFFKHPPPFPPFLSPACSMVFLSFFLFLLSFLPSSSHFPFSLRRNELD